MKKTIYIVIEEIEDAYSRTRETTRQVNDLLAELDCVWPTVPLKPPTDEKIIESDNLNFNKNGE